MEDAVSSTIAPDRILKQLADLWIAEGKQGDTGVLRACSMTLCVLADPGDDPGAFGRPDARLIVETGSPAGDLRDGLAHDYVMASTGCIPSSGNVTVDDLADLPGPIGSSTPSVMRLVE